MKVPSFLGERKVKGKKVELKKLDLSRRSATNFRLYSIYGTREREIAKVCESVFSVVVRSTRTASGKIRGEVRRSKERGGSTECSISG